MNKLKADKLGEATFLRAALAEIMKVPNTVAGVAAAITLTVLRAYNLNWRANTMSERFAVGQMSVPSRLRPKFGLLLFILASNLGESK